MICDVAEPTEPGQKGTARVRHLRLIGYWRSDHTLDWPNVADFVDPDWDEDSRRLTIDYLQSGALARRFWGVSYCRLCGAENGHAELTDGEWLWPEGLAHYLERHEVRLPDEFVEHARRRFAKVSEEEIDRSWWRNFRTRGLRSAD
jgi:hypothetical protein